MPDSAHHDLTALKPCRFCGCTEFLQVLPGYEEWQVYDGDELRLGPDGEPVLELYDAVDCSACCATAPMVVWQAEPGCAWRPAQLNAYRSFLDTTASEEAAA